MSAGFVGSPTFDARYHGTCEACGEHVTPGDQVRYDADGDRGVLVHDDCEQVESHERPVTICPECHMTTCDCEVAA